jgi:hypothetical protein
MDEDYYIRNPKLLEGQPKRAIADYVQSNGILTPRRFSSLAEARRSGLPILVRSEHPQDYDGASGLLESFRLERVPDRMIETGLKQFILSRRSFPDSPNLILPKITSAEQYCQLTGKDITDFENATSFSLWEKLGGFNRTIVADNAIKGRYHIVTYKSSKDQSDVSTYSYSIFDRESNLVNDIALSKLNGHLTKDLPSLVDFYESIRKLSRFNPNHCPIIEAQTVDGGNYFLQYHKGRKFEPSTFVLDRPAEGREIKANFVRGATPPIGLDLDATLYYPINDFVRGSPKNLLKEEASFDNHDWKVFSELMIRDRKAQIIDCSDFSFEMHKFATGHLEISKLFKPGISVVSNFSSFISEDIKPCFDRLQSVRLHLISDGRNAYISSLDKK